MKFGFYVILTVSYLDFGKIFLKIPPNTLSGSNTSTNTISCVLVCSGSVILVISPQLLKIKNLFQKILGE